MVSLSSRRITRGGVEGLGRVQSQLIAPIQVSRSRQGIGWKEGKRTLLSQWGPGHWFAHQGNKWFTTKSKLELVAQPDKGVLEKTRPWLNSWAAWFLVAQLPLLEKRISWPCASGWKVGSWGGCPTSCFAAADTRSLPLPPPSSTLCILTKINPLFCLYHQYSNNCLVVISVPWGEPRRSLLLQ